jgi:hypothetical protein
VGVGRHVDRLELEVDIRQAAQQPHAMTVTGEVEGVK